MPVVSLNQNRLYFYCPGCECHHRIDITQWTWNGSLTNPTITPSVLTRGFCPNKTQINCHLYITDGAIRYLSDSHHTLAGQTVPMVPLEPEDSNLFNAFENS